MTVLYVIKKKNKTVQFFYECLSQDGKNELVRFTALETDWSSFTNKGSSRALCIPEGNFGELTVFSLGPQASISFLRLQQQGRVDFRHLCHFSGASLGLGH